MTVCIAALCEENKEEREPKIVVASDRMITTGVTSRIEYEHTGSKIVPLHFQNSFLGIGLSSGAVSLTEDFFQKINRGIEDFVGRQSEGPRAQLPPIPIVAQIGVNSYQQIVRETIDRQVFGPFDLSLDDLKVGDDENEIHPGLLNSLIRGAVDIRDQIHQGLNIVITGIDETGGHIYTISKGDSARHNSIGYITIGSGAELARLALIHRDYDTACSVEEALHSVVSAKKQAEEAQGVGRKMDIAVISREKGMDIFDEGEVDKLSEIEERISEEEKEARENVLQDEDYTHQ